MNRTNSLRFVGHSSIGPRVLLLLAPAALALGMPAERAAAETSTVSIELNKLEPLQKGCRVLFVVSNTSDKTIDALKLDLAVFQPDGVIGNHFIFDFAPVKASKRAITQFVLDQTPCEQIGSILVNEATECRTASGTMDDCLAHVAVSSLAKAQITK